MNDDEANGPLPPDMRWIETRMTLEELGELEILALELNVTPDEVMRRIMSEFLADPALFDTDEFRRELKRLKDEDRE